MNILTFDLETGYMLNANFSLWEETRNHKNIVQDWYIICGAWKWIDSARVEAVSLLDDPDRFKDDITDDYHVVKRLHEELGKADILVGHNIDRFDIPKLNTRFYYHGLPPLPKVRTLDTLKMAKRAFKFSSNRLDYIAQYGKDAGEGKMNTTQGLWLKALQGDEEAIKEMVEYNKQDIVISEDVMLKLRPFDQSPTNLSVYMKDGVAGSPHCPKCNSNSIQKRGYSYTTAGKFQRYQCQNCGGWSRGRENLMSKKHTGKTIAEQLLTSQ